MKMQFFYYIIIISIFGSISFNSLDAEGLSACNAVYKETPLINELATAGAYANYTNKKGSVSSESVRIFHDAKSKVQSLEKVPDSFCPENCIMQPVPYMYFNSVPNKFLTRYDDYDKCAKSLEETTKNPIYYTYTGAKSVDDLTNWIGSFSRGNGPEGKDLYKKCDGQCSPQYHYMISKETPEAENFIVSISVICGHARDKDDDNYQLSSSFRQICKNK